MKYTQEQGIRARRQEKRFLTKKHTISEVFKEIKLKKHFPIKVDIEGRFYVIESKINYDSQL